MFDTVDFKLTNVDCGVSFLEEVPCYLANVGFHDYNGQQVITGDLNGLKVSINENQIKVKGSVCKWQLGDNFQAMGRQDMERAVERLSDLLHLPMSRATITRIDVANNFITRHPAAVYINHLGLLKYSTRLQEPSGLYYAKRDERLCFYDKCREQRASGGKIPDLFRDKNVLRYEQRYLKRLPQQFKVEKVTAAMLYDETFYIGLLQHWGDTYKAIKKINDITLNFQAMRSKQQLYKMGVLTMVEQFGGEVEMMNLIAEAQKRGDLTTKQAYDLRQAVKAACEVKEGLTVKSDVITELDKKVMEAIAYYR